MAQQRTAFPRSSEIGTSEKALCAGGDPFAIVHFDLGDSRLEHCGVEYFAGYSFACLSRFPNGHHLHVGNAVHRAPPPDAAGGDAAGCIFPQDENSVAGTGY